MKRIPFYSPLCMLCAALAVLAACGKESDNTLPDSPPGAEALRVQATRLGFVEEDGKTRATTDDATMKTTFEPGDAIGIFAVRDGVVQTDCKNLKLTMQPDGSWGGNTVFFIEGATYFAYSPYRDVAGINSAVSINNIVANFTLSNNQNTAALYAANDLMTSTTCTADKEAKTLSIAFEHQFALLEMERAYCKGKGAAYPLNSTVPSELHLLDLPEGADNVVIGYRKGSIMRFLLKPGSRSIAPVFLQGNGTYLTFYTTPNPLLNLTQGKRFRLKPQKKRDVQVGDYYYSDGSVYPKEWKDAGGTPPNRYYGCIGVVFASGETGISSGDNVNNYVGTGLKEGINGYVMAVDVVRSGDWYAWGPTNITVGTSNSYADFLGYSNTQKIKGMLRYNEKIYPACWQACNYSETAPSSSSGWFLPSKGQWRHIYMSVGEAILDPILKGVGSTGLDKGDFFLASMYSTSSEASATEIHIQNNRSQYAIALKSYGYDVWPFLAF